MAKKLNICDKSTVVIYARVSTNEQELGQQIAACQRFCEYKQFDVAQIYQDVMSGTNNKRPSYLKMVEELRTLKYGAVVVFRLDRLGRSLREMVMLIEELENKGVKIYSLNESFDTSTAIGRAMMNLILVFAEFEREQISEATKQRLAAVKAAGGKLGRRHKSKVAIRKVRQLRASGGTYAEIVGVTGYSFGTVFNIINKRGVYAQL